MLTEKDLQVLEIPKSKRQIFLSAPIEQQVKVLEHFQTKQAEIVNQLESQQNVFFRITTEEDDLQRASTEIADISREDAALTFGCEVDDLDETLEEFTLVYDDSRGGVFWDGGVCCCDSIDGLVDYARQIGGFLEPAQLGDFEVVCFRGEYIADCRDGDVAECHEILFRCSATVLNELKEIE